MMRRRREPQFWASVMSREELTALADYNGERSRGLLHTPEYAARMAALQGKFHEAREAEAHSKGWIVIGASDEVVDRGDVCDWCKHLPQCDGSGACEAKRTGSDLSERYFDTLLSVTDDPAEKARIEELRASRERGEAS